MTEDPSNHNAQLSMFRGGGKPLPPTPMGSGGLATARGDEGGIRRAGGGVPNIWRIAHNALRGHYVIFLIASVLSAVILAALAWKLAPQPTFPSEGSVRIAYTLPRVRVATDQNEPMPMFEEFMQSQKPLIQSRRAVDMAMRDPIWKTTAMPADPVKYYAQHLTVDIPPKSELIKFSVNDRDAQTAAAAVTAIIDAYADLYKVQDTHFDKQRLTVLEDQQKQLQSQYAALAEQLRVKAKQYGSTQLDASYADLQTKQSRLESALNDIQITMAEAGAAAGPTAPAPERLATVAPGDLTNEQIAGLDPQVSAYWQQKQQAQDDVDRLTTYGYGKRHPLMATALRNLEFAEAHVQKYADAYRRNHPASATPTYDQRAVAGAAGRSVSELKVTEANLRKLLADANTKRVELGNANIDLHRMQDNLTAKRTELAGVSQRIEDLQSEGALGGRLTVVSKGEVSLKSSKDIRGKVAGLGGFIGFFLPAFGAVMFTLARRRFRFSDEAANDLVVSRAPVLGMLPNVPARGTSSQLRVAAAYAAHHLRVLLSSRATTVVKRTFLVTSAGEGDGKTTVTMALAISFAASRHRTLVIDGDFVGRRLTRGFNAEQQEGLFESMGQGDMDGQWLNAATNLCILPTGKVDAADACVITAENVRLLLEQAIQHFDVVLIDTGSILGSPESAVLAREVDGVIMTISRGQSQGQVRRAMLRLEALGALVVGTVFNRANIKDFQSSYCTPTSGWNQAEQPEPAMESELQQRVANFGPLVRAVAAAVPAETPHEDVPA